MNDEIELISDGDGLAVIGDPAVVDRFLVAEGLTSEDLRPRQLSRALSTASIAANSSSQIAAESGRWMKLTEESARAAEKYALVHNSTTGYAHATLRASNGQFVKNLQFVGDYGAILTSPAFLAGAAGIMAQLAMQQAMEEITEYLAVIDAKVDDVLRAQKDAVLADMIAVGLVLDEAMAVRGQVGRVGEITWSKVQDAPMTIARTQSYALRQLDALAEKLENKAPMGDLAKAAKKAEETVQEWLAVLARCAQLQDGVAVLELDRVLDASPDELDRYRIGLRAARKERYELIARSTDRLMARVTAVAATANAKVLLHPASSPAVVRSRNDVVNAIVDFNSHFGIEPSAQELDAKRWVEAATEFGGKAVETGADGLDAAIRLGDETLDRAKLTTGRFAGAISERLLRGSEQGAGK